MRIVYLCIFTGCVRQIETNCALQLKRCLPINQMEISHARVYLRQNIINTSRSLDVAILRRQHHLQPAPEPVTSALRKSLVHILHWLLNGPTESFTGVVGMLVDDRFKFAADV